MSYDPAWWDVEREVFDATAPDRRIIELIPIPDVEWGAEESLYPVTTPAQVEVATRIGRYWKNETRYGSTPVIEVASPTRVTLLIKSTAGTMAPLAGGGVEMEQPRDHWVLTWVWLHPFERSGRSNEWWPALEKEFGDFGTLSVSLR